MEREHIKAVKAPPVDGKAAWHGFYRLARADAWQPVESLYGRICYALPEAACNAASWKRSERLREMGLACAAEYRRLYGKDN